MNEAFLVFLVWLALVLIAPLAMWLVAVVRRNRSRR